jgi:hypothetical protein
MSQNLQGRGLGDRKRIWGDIEIAVEVAGDRRSWIAVALRTDFRSQVHFVEFLRQSIFGVFQRYRLRAVIRSSRLDGASAPGRRILRPEGGSRCGRQYSEHKLT